MTRSGFLGIVASRFYLEMIRILPALSAIASTSILDGGFRQA
ncbi:MAG: hypothetical protein U9N31_01900 [Candidatus Marinimicrobia bacterium]|nr:hypothetical protein [Candidatus Neomarinimicrobiota bacterium]